ncbi:hypothetical protein [Alloalcanivorax gelatiniphagus]|uniref:Uncharacterized protein n=1 Tax=Alloalcanivorax gelatiniphagus TaxID=1194167 RepID=A0ABY2XIY2_9GAMM|nr:hypothetical protein [Alloalcanivorax gelatiniphagus]TMW11229.1 hypothetical protein FGS76_14305 [Alloalcanivorax gelatiniphagus]
MRNLIVPIILATLFVAGCSDGGSSQSSSESVAAEATASANAADVAAAPQQERPVVSIGWLPSEACSFLDPTLVTRGYRHDFDDEYHCSSPYKDIGQSDMRLANNLAYYVTGSANVADTVKLVLNYNQPENASLATEKLIAASKALSFKAAGGDLPPGVLSALSAGRSTSEVSGEFKHEVKRDDWPTGRGYEIHYIITKSVER